MNRRRFFNFCRQPLHRTCSLLFVMVVIAIGIAFLVLWVGGAHRQRNAIHSLEAIAGCSIHYDFESYPCRLPTDQPSRLETYLERDYVHSVVIVSLGIEQIQQALPSLRQLADLQQIRVFSHANDKNHDRRLSEAINELRKKFPHLKVEEAGQCPILISVVPVVG